MYWLCGQVSGNILVLFIKTITITFFFHEQIFSLFQTMHLIGTKKSFSAKINCISWTRFNTAKRQKKFANWQCFCIYYYFLYYLLFIFCLFIIHFIIQLCIVSYIENTFPSLPFNYLVLQTIKLWTGFLINTLNFGKVNFRRLMQLFESPAKSLESSITNRLILWVGWMFSYVL